MPTNAVILILKVGIIGLSLGVLVVLLRRGELREKHLRLAPTRNLHEHPLVYLAGIYLVMFYAALKLQVSSDAPFELQFAMELVPFAFIGLMLGRARRAEAGFRKLGLLPRWPGRDLRWGLVSGVVGFGLAGLSGLFAIQLFSLLNEPAPEVAHKTLVTLQTSFSLELLISIIVSAVIIAPLLEELVFRGVLQTSLMRWFKGRRWIAIVITAMVFSSIHGWVVPTQGLIPLFVLGLVWGYLYERTGSLVVPILSHAVFNAANIALALHLPETPPA
ncbi:MAG: type II CAAX endopeptidase family protein [Planctomycetota bacterium]